MRRCRKGHVKTPDNVYVDRRGHRRCRRCQLLKNKFYATYKRRRPDHASH